jgi:hypothetical protein
MADTVKRVEYFATEVPNRPGMAAAVLGALSGEGVNLLAFTGFPAGRRAQLDFVPENAAAFRKAVARLKMPARARKTGFLIQGDDRKGAVAAHLGRLADARVNVTAIDAVSAGKKRFGAILWVKPADAAKAAKALGAK